MFYVKSDSGIEFTINNVPCAPNIGDSIVHLGNLYKVTERIINADTEELIVNVELVHYNENNDLDLIQYIIDGEVLKAITEYSNRYNTGLTEATKWASAIKLHIHDYKRIFN